MPFVHVLSYGGSATIQTKEYDAFDKLSRAKTAALNHAVTDANKKTSYNNAITKFQQLIHTLNTSTLSHKIERIRIARIYEDACQKFVSAYAAKIAGNIALFTTRESQAKARLITANGDKHNLKTMLGIVPTPPAPAPTLTPTPTPTPTPTGALATSTTAAKPTATEMKAWDADYESKKTAVDFVFSKYLAELIESNKTKDTIEKRLWWAVRKPEFGDGDAVMRVEAKAQRVKAMMADSIPEDLAALKNKQEAYMFVDNDGITMKPLKDLDQMSKLAVIIAYSIPFATDCGNCNEFRKMMFVRIPDLSRGMIVHAMKAADFGDQLRELSDILSQWNDIDIEKIIATAKVLDLVNDKFTETFIQKYSDFGKILLYRRLNYVIACLKMRQAVDIHDTKDVLMLNDQITSLQKAITSMNIVV
jgi:hypothetical protein